METLAKLQGHGFIARLHDDYCLTKTRLGHYLVVPVYNLDVGIGVMRDGIIEPWTTAIVQSILKPEDICINVGANFGYYSVLSAALVGSKGKVYAVEANPYIFVALIMSCYWSGCVNIIEAYNFAAYHEDIESIQLSFDPQFLGGGNIFSGQTVVDISDCFWSGENIHKVLNNKRKFEPRGMITSVAVPGYKLDYVFSDISNVKLIHIDAEGAESFIICGAENIIKRSPKVNLIIEWDPINSYDNKRRSYVDKMWDILLNDMKLIPYRIEPEDYPGVGSMPNLRKLDRESLFNVPHSDILLK